jgi:hypothetical protein
MATQPTAACSPPTPSNRNTADHGSRSALACGLYGGPAPGGAHPSAVGALVTWSPRWRLGSVRGCGQTEVERSGVGKVLWKEEDGRPVVAGWVRPRIAWLDLEGEHGAGRP